MNRNELIEHVVGQTDLPKAAASAAIDAVVGGITAALKQGDEVRLLGFGTFSVKDRPAGTGRNPSTGKEIDIPASKSARFKPGLALRAAMNPKDDASSESASSQVPAKPRAKRAT